MSSTRTGSEKRDHLDRYYTPEALARACTALFMGSYGHPSDLQRILEPGVGGGAFARALKAHGAHVTGIDVDFMAPGADDCDVWSVTDFRGYMPTRRFDAVIGNPPFKHAEAFVTHGLRLAPVVGFLMRIAFVSGVGRYRRLWGNRDFRGGLRYFYPLVERASFTPDGKTDSADYAFYIIERGYTGDFSGRPVSWKP